MSKIICNVSWFFSGLLVKNGSRWLKIHYAKKIGEVNCDIGAGGAGTKIIIFYDLIIIEFLLVWLEILNMIRGIECLKLVELSILPH